MIIVACIGVLIQEKNLKGKSDYVLLFVAVAKLFKGCF